MKPQLIIEICPHEPRTSVYLANGDSVETAPDILQHLEDCNQPGDCEQACLFVLNHIGVEFRTVARNAGGQYENRPATADEKTATCRAIYFDSDSEFSDESIAETYLVWQAASHLEG